MEKMIEINDNDMAEVSGSGWFTSYRYSYSYNSQCPSTPAPAPACPTDPKGSSGGSDPKDDPKNTPPCPTPAPVVCKPVVSWGWCFGKCW